MSTALAHPDPWDRMQGEGLKAFQAFCGYRDMDPQIRSIRKAAENAGKAEATFNGFSQRWAWVERAGAYDEYRDRQNRAARETAEQKMIERHLAAARTVQLPGLRRLQGDREANVQRVDPNTMTAIEAARVVEIGVKLERLAQGLSDGQKGGLAISPGEVRAIVQRAIDDGFDVIAACMKAAIDGDTDVERWQGEFFDRLEAFVNGREWRQG